MTRLFAFSGRYRVLHMTWFAFFLTFVVWFSFAPFATTLGREFGLDASQLATIALCNVALTVPARVVIGMFLDRFGPRLVYTAVLAFGAVASITFAASTSFSMLVISRLALSVVGAGFVVGIRMVAEWFGPDEVGLAEGVYGGWGNAGSAVAALTLPTVGALLGGWRWATGLAGIVAGLYAIVYVMSVRDTPDGVVYLRARRAGALEVGDRGGVIGLIVLSVPLVGVLALVLWRLERTGVLPAALLAWGLAGLGVLFVVQVRRIVVVNRQALGGALPPDERYPFRSVTLLSLAYAVTFGSELAVVSMLPTFVETTWGLDPRVAGAVASAFAFVNLVARPAGGLLSDNSPSRAATIRRLLGALAVGYFAMAALGAWVPVVLAVVVVMACSASVQAGEGAVFAFVPLVHRRVTGQIAGIVGAYGNIGALVYLTALLFLGPRAFFIAIGASALAVTVACRMLPEPSASVGAAQLEPASV